jgi:mannose/cellobiose epimerase-like protein (N-acyl-D-glucosamine 2-epimerase family)
MDDASDTRAYGGAAAPGTWSAASPPEPPAQVLDAEMHRLLRFAEGALAPGGGFGRLDDDGRLRPDHPIETWVSTRMTYCFALGSLVGRDGDAERVDHGLAALRPGGCLRDDTHGGWFASVRPEGRDVAWTEELATREGNVLRRPEAASGASQASPVAGFTDNGRRPVVDDTKAAYAHAFVVLAAAAGVVAGRPAAAAVLTDALSVVERYFWDDDAGMMRESFSADWASEEPYRGANANMHSVEAFLAAADALRGPDGAVWRERAARIVERIIHGIARESGWRLPEHFSADFVVDLDYNTDDRAHPFRPYGVTPGHLFEWARLCLHLRAAEAAAGRPAPDWLLGDAAQLYRTAVEIGWASDGHEGFVYTTDYDGAPITRARMHWVLTEALGAAAALHQVTGEASYAEDHRRWWRFAEAHFIDRERGSWRAELGPNLRPAAGIWSGKPDVYHALQATLVPRLPLAPMFAAALRGR